MTVPKVVAVGMEGSYVVSAVCCDDFELTVAIQVVDSDGRLNLAHLKRKSLSHFAVAVDNIYESNTCTDENLQLAVAIQIRKYRVAIQERPELGQIGGQI